MTGGSDHAAGERSGAGDRDGATGGDGSGGSRAGTPWVGIVANRGSGVGRGRRLVEELVTELRRLGICRPRSPGRRRRARPWCSRAARDGDCRCLVAVGGDGTVSALLNERPEPAAHRHAGRHREPRRPPLRPEARPARTGPDDRRRPVRARGRRPGRRPPVPPHGRLRLRRRRRRPATIAGGSPRSGRIRPTSRMAYVEPILRSSFSYRFPTISVRILDPGAEEVLRGTTVFIFNLPRYALGLPFVPVAREDDGWLDLVVFRHPGPFQALYYLWKVVCGIHLHDPSVYHRRVRKVVVTAHEAIPVQLDGDPGGYVLPQPRPPPADRRRRTAPPAGDTATATRSRADPAEWTVEILPSALSMLRHRPPRPTGRRGLRSPPTASVVI